MTKSMRPAAARIRDIWSDPPRGGWTRRTFLQTLTAAAALPLATSSSAFAQARTAGGRIKITDLKLQRIRVEKEWGTYEDYMGGRRGGRTGGGAVLEIYTDQGPVGIGPGVVSGVIDKMPVDIADVLFASMQGDVDAARGTLVTVLGH